MEYAPKGDLSEFIQWHKSQDKKVTESKIWQIGIQILKGLEVLHENRIMHRDLKPSNVFIMGQGRIKLADFNLSRIFDIGEELAHTQRGTPIYSA